MVVKVLKIRIRRAEDNTMIYPPAYFPGLSKKVSDHLYCHNDKLDICHLLVSLDEKYIDTIHDWTDIQVLSLASSEEWSNKYNPKTQVFTDQPRLTALDIKVRTNPSYKLTVEEEKAIDPDDPTPGVQWKKTFIDRIKEKNEL